MMTPHEQRMAISDWMGWKMIDAYAHTVQWAGRWVEGNNNPIETATEIPNYPEDLNACNGVEKRLSETERYVYSIKLHGLVYHDSKFDAGFTNVLCATAAQRTEALCKTLFPERFE